MICFRTRCTGTSVHHRFLRSSSIVPRGTEFVGLVCMTCMHNCRRQLQARAQCDDGHSLHMIVPPYGPGLVGQHGNRLGLESSQPAGRNGVSGNSVIFSHRGNIAWETPTRTNGSFWLVDRGVSSAEIMMAY